jgi:hypothetical protein
MPTSREVWDTIERLRLLPTGEADRVKERWFRPGRDGADDVNQFARWLVSNDVLSKYAIEEVVNGRGDGLRVGNYLLLGPQASGPHAGSFLAADTLGRKVLIDLVDEKLAADPDVVRAFEAAAERVMGVQSPHVNRVIDFGKAGGRLYLARELDEGVTLAEILDKRQRLEPNHAARLFSQVFAGLQALHEKQVQGGDLSPERILLASTGKKGRVVKLLRPGMPAALFKGGEAAAVIPALRPVSRPEDDLFLLGQSFYRSLTGKESEATLAGGQAARPVRQLAPEVPELLAEAAEQLLFPELSARPKAASRIAKTLRVYLASEEESRERRAEEEIAPAEVVTAVAVEPEEEPVEAEFGKDSAAPTNRLAELWAEFGPKQRDWLFLAAGAAGIILIILLVHVLLGRIGIFNVVCLLTGAALSFLAERMIANRREAELE